MAKVLEFRIPPRNMYIAFKDDACTEMESTYKFQIDTITDRVVDFSQNIFNSGDGILLERTGEALFKTLADLGYTVVRITTRHMLEHPE